MFKYIIMEIYGQNSVVSEYPPKDTKSLWVDKGQLKMFINGKWQNVGGGDASNEDSSGDSSGDISEHDCEYGVNFYDYDGTLLYHYTPKQALALTELPPGPNTNDSKHDGLEFDGWGQDLEDIIKFNGNLDIGAQYASLDNNYIFDIDINNEDLYDLQLHIYYKYYSGNIIVHWGDGTIENIQPKNGYQVLSHSYKKKGIYRIKIPFDVINICYNPNNSYSDYYGIFGQFYGSYKYMQSMKFYNAVLTYTITTYAQGYMYPNAKNVIIPSNGLSNDKYKRIYIGNQVYDFGNLNCLSLAKEFSLQDRNSKTFTIKINKLLYGKSSYSGDAIYDGEVPLTVYLNSEATLKDTYKIKKIVASKFPSINNCSGITEITILEGCTRTSELPYNDINISIKLPSTISEIKSQNQSSSNGRFNFYLDKVKQIPTIDSNNRYSYETLHFYVPKKLFYEYLNATNWSYRGSHIHPCEDDMFKFSVTGAGYFIAEKHSTWEQWVNSEYCVGNFSISDGIVLYNDTSNVQYGSENVLATDLIYPCTIGIDTVEYSIAN